MCQRAGFEVGDDLLDDRVAAVVGLGLHEGQWRVGEPGVVTPGRNSSPTITRRRRLNSQYHRPGLTR